MKIKQKKTNKIKGKLKKTKKQKVRFLGIVLDSLGASVLKVMLASKGAITADTEMIREREKF